VVNVIGAPSFPNEEDEDEVSGVWRRVGERGGGRPRGGGLAWGADVPLPLSVCCPARDDCMLLLLLARRSASCALAIVEAICARSLSVIAAAAAATSRACAWNSRRFTSFSLIITAALLSFSFSCDSAVAKLGTPLRTLLVASVAASTSASTAAAAASASAAAAEAPKRARTRPSTPPSQLAEPAEA
jgi:hypothetical protein